MRTRTELVDSFSFPTVVKWQGNEGFLSHIPLSGVGNSFTLKINSIFGSNLFSGVAKQDADPSKDLNSKIGSVILCRVAILTLVCHNLKFFNDGVRTLCKSIARA